MSVMMTIFKSSRLLMRIWNNPTIQKNLVWKWWAWRYRKVDKVRFSISALVRICVDGDYLLVKNRKWNKYQPVGGVLQHHPTAQSVLDDLQVTHDSMFSVDDINRDDLRVQVPGKNIWRFLTWFEKNRGRENSPNREFEEELFGTGILDRDAFGSLRFNSLRRHVDGIEPCERLGGQLECKIAEIYDLVATQEQVAMLQALKSRQDDRYLIADEALIKRLGIKPKEVYEENITDTASWVL